LARNVIWSMRPVPADKTMATMSVPNT
jgi:hypothetical protein